MVTQESFAGVLKQRRWAVSFAILIIATVAGWLGLRFLYFGAYWWAAWTFAMVLKMGVLNVTQFTSFYIILEYLGTSYLLEGIVVYYIWIFYGVFTYSVIPFLFFLIFTSIPFAVIALIILALRSREDVPFWVNIPVGIGAFIVGILQFIAIIVLLATNPWAQLYIPVTFFLWAWIDLLIIIFLPLGLTVLLPIGIVYGLSRIKR